MSVLGSRKWNGRKRKNTLLFPNPNYEFRFPVFNAGERFRARTDGCRGGQLNRWRCLGRRRCRRRMLPGGGAHGKPTKNNPGQAVLRV